LTAVPHDAIDAVAARLFDALRSLDVDAMRDLLTPDAVRWANLSGAEDDVASLLGMLEAERAVFSEHSLALTRQLAADGGFVLQLVMSGTTHGGAKVEVPVCLVVTVDGDRVSRIDEYASLHHVEPMLPELYRSNANDR
jgi:ketosteroid isomerase-like protein